MNAVIYCRLSDEHSSEFSIAQQEARCRDWAAANGHVVLRVYTDDGVSGTKVARAGFTQLRREARGLGARMLIVADLDRFMRNLREQLNLKHELDTLGIALVSLADSGVIDTRTPEGMLNFQVKGMVSEFHARTTGRKVSQTLEHKAK
jgi:site-specific DNA recombinase